MIERIIENWLDNASERSYQIPFCYLLANEGHTILHLTRHCGMEHGKDIITRDSDGNICVYQLKGFPKGKLKVSNWQELLGQVNQMIFTPVNHPSANSTTHHLSYLVTNGEIEEEVFTAIDSFNKDWVQKGQPQYKLNTIVRGEILKMANNLKDQFLPPNINDMKSFLEFFLQDGEGVIDKSKLATLLESTFEKQPKSAREAKEFINSTALLVSIVTTNFSNKNNHVAVVESWIMYVAYLFRFVERQSLNESDWKNEYLIAYKIIFTALENLFEEIKNQEHLLVGNYITDVFFHNSRFTWIVGFISSFGIILNRRERDMKKISEFEAFIVKHKLEIWGESALPCTLVRYWFSKLTNPTEYSGEFLKTVTDIVINRIGDKDTFFPEVYYGIEECLVVRVKGMSNDAKIGIKHESQFLEGLVHLLTRENYKQKLIGIWPDVSKQFFREFLFSDLTDFYLWRAKQGKENLKTPIRTQQWKDLKNEAAESSGETIPKLLKENPDILLLFILVYPHRCSSSVVRWIDTQISNWS